MVVVPIAFGPVVRQHIIVGACGRGRCSRHGCQEEKRGRKEMDSNLSFQEWLKQLKW
jgi:hypothetical protein